MKGAKHMVYTQDQAAGKWNGGLAALLFLAGENGIVLEYASV